MSFLSLIPLSLSLIACRSGTIETDSEDPSTNDGGDSVGDDTGEPAEYPVADVSWALHEEIESLVYVSWEQPEQATVWVEYSFDDGEWHSSPPFTASPGPQTQLLLGIPYESSFSFHIVNDLGEGPLSSGDFSAETGPLPEALPVPTVLSADPSRYEPTGNYLYASINAQTGGWTGGEYWQFIMDRQGRIVWALPTPDGHWTIYVRTSYDGDDLMWEEQTYWVDYKGDDSKVYRMKIDGSIVETYDTPGLHHAWTELSDGTIVWGAVQDHTDESLETLRLDGTRETLWLCSAFHASLGTTRSCQSNALFWHEASDTFLYSFYTTSTVVHIDAQTGETLHHWGLDLGDWDFDPEDAAFDWQHGATFTDEGTLLLSTHVTTYTSECATREYVLDEDDETLHQTWSFGPGQGLNCNTAGEAHRLPNENTLHNLGSGAWIREITPSGEVVWDVEWPDGQSDGRLLGRSIFLDDLYTFAP